MKKINYFTPAAAMLSQHNAAERFSAALPKAIKGVRFAGTDRGPLDGAVIHDCPRLLCLLSGAAEFWTSQSGERLCHTFKAGDVLFTSSGSWMKPGSQHSRDALILSLVFQQDYLRVLLSVPMQRQHKGRSLRWWYHSGQSLCGSAAHLLHALEAFQHEHTNDDHKTAAHLVSGLLNRVAYFLAHDHAPAHSKAMRTWLLIKQYIAENLNDQLSRDAVARALNIHPNHVSRLTRSQHNMTFKAYVQEQRMHVAQNLLTQHRDLSLDEVASRCGFSSRAYFARIFRANTGQSPDMFRSAAFPKH